MKISALAPKEWPHMPALEGVRLGSVEAGIKYQGRKDLLAMIFDEPAQIAGVFTRSKCPSAPVDWCRSILDSGCVRSIIINSGNANAFTGRKGREAVEDTLDAVEAVFGHKRENVYLASTGVIGEPMDAGDFAKHLMVANSMATSQQWEDAAKTIMTTDTYHKMATVTFDVGAETFTLNGIAKGSGMIAPNMATMLAFLVTDLPLSNKQLQSHLSTAIEGSFNAISVDSDTSTSDTVLLAATQNRLVDFSNSDMAQISASFAKALQDVLHELAMLVIRDGEGASKHVEISVKGAVDDCSAKKIALSIANSPLVKTAIAGEDANWGRVVMAVGKAGEPAERDLLDIAFGDVRVAHQGERDPAYDEDKASQVMKKEFIPVSVNLNLGDGQAKVWTCDLTHAYIDINADYRS